MRRLIAPLAALATLAAVAPAMAATSSNWAGYAVSRSGTKFKKVTGTWVQPTVDCSNSARTYSAYWVGLGGFHSDSSALEQIGTEADCTSSGSVHYEAWYEVVPATAVTLKMTIRPGDRMSASVTVTGHSVRMRMADETTGAVAVKTLVAKNVDTRSAEWIVEAPSLCDTAGNCQTQALADFGTASFSRVNATTTSGHTGTLTDTAWTRTPISLSTQGRGFGGPGGGRFVRESSSATAQPGSLSPSGASFAVTYGP
jgi:hypothetical protein